MIFPLGPLLHNTAAMSGSVSTAWTPASLGASLFGWWSADQASTVNTGSTNVWTPYSGSAGALTQATSANRPTYSGSGATSKLTFDSTDELDLASAPAVYDAVAVITLNSSNATWRTLFWAASGFHPLLFQSGGDLLGVYNTGFQVSTGSLSVAPSTMAIVQVRADASLNMSLAINGNALGATTTTMPSSADTPIAVVGSSSGGGQPVGDIHAIVITNSLLSTTSGAELDKVVGNLAWTWGLQGSLPVGHAYKSAAP